MRHFLGLFKLRIVALLVFVSVVSMILAGSGAVELRNLALLIAAGTLASAGASAINNYMDRDIDAKMKRTRSRALPRHVLEPRIALITGISLIVASVFLSLSLNLLTTSFVLLGAFVYVVVYTLLLKRRTWLNIVLGGASGSFAVLAGWAAATGEINTAALLLSIILFLWTPSHFWSFAMVYSADYARAGVPMLPSIVSHRKAAKYLLANTFALFIATLILSPVAGLGYVYLTLAFAAGLYFLYLNVRLLENSGVAWKAYKSSGVYLIAVFLGIALEVLV